VSRNDLAFVRETIDLLQNRGSATWLFGGRAADRLVVPEAAGAAGME
jgi:hypothetical protein